MRSRLILFTLSLYLTLSVLGCTSKPSSDSSTTDTSNATNSQDATSKAGSDSKEHKEGKEHKEARREPVVVPAGTAVTVSLGSAIGSKLSQSGQTFNGSVAKDVLVGNSVAIP